MNLLSLVLSVIIFSLYLVYERLTLDRRRNLIPLRISVTGTRGKSSVVRMLASILREDGRRIIAKTTGSEAKIILPDAQEIEVARRRIVSIIEQKDLIKKAAEVHADCLVAEIMSIHPENHYIESRQILQPNIVVITNVREDHTEAMGKTKDEIASVFCLDVPEKATVFIPEKESRALIESAVKNTNGELIRVLEGSSSSLGHASEIGKKEFPDNLDLVFALAQHLGIDRDIISSGIRKARHDLGQLKIWVYRSPETQKTFYLVNGFAANDPESTLQVIAKVREVLPPFVVTPFVVTPLGVGRAEKMKSPKDPKSLHDTHGESNQRRGGFEDSLSSTRPTPEGVTTNGVTTNKLIGLLSLRADRGDRTKQWLESLSGAFEAFSRIYVTGAHTHVFKRKLKSVSVLKSNHPEELTKTLLAESEDQSVIFGFGNIKGMGEQLVEYWNEIGEVYEL